MYSFKTLIQALLVASIATSSLAVVLPDRDVIHAERALLLGPGLAEGLERIGPAGLKALVNTDIKKTLTGVQQIIKNVTNSVREFDLDGSPDVTDPIKAPAFRGVRNRVGRSPASSSGGISYEEIQEMIKDLMILDGAPH